MSAPPVALFLSITASYERHGSGALIGANFAVRSVMRWERATPMALMGTVIDKKSAIGVARSQQEPRSMGKVSAYEWRAPSERLFFWRRVGRRNVLQECITFIIDCHPLQTTPLPDVGIKSVPLAHDSERAGRSRSGRE